MMDVYETNVSSGKQLQFVNLKMLVLPHLYLCSHIPPHPHPLNDSGGGGGGHVHCGHGSDDLATGQWSRSTLPAPRRPLKAPERPALVPPDAEPGPPQAAVTTVTLGAAPVVTFPDSQERGRRPQRWAGPAGGPAAVRSRRCVPAPEGVCQQLGRSPCFVLRWVSSDGHSPEVGCLENWIL